MNELTACRWDSDSIKYITEMDLIELGLKGGARRKILSDKSRFPVVAAASASHSFNDTIQLKGCCTLLALS